LSGEFTVADRLELHELAARYANTIDDRDWDRFRTVFTDGCRYELSGFGRLDCVIVGNESLTQFMIGSGSHPVAHHVTNVEVDATGDEVRMFSKVVGTLPGGNVGSGDYRDRVVKTTGGWKIAERIVTLRRGQR
jgi:SnoaL-like domain